MSHFKFYSAEFAVGAGEGGNGKTGLADCFYANYWINRPPILVRSVPVIPVPNVPPKLKKDSKLAKSIC